MRKAIVGLAALTFLGFAACSDEGGHTPEPCDESLQDCSPTTGGPGGGKKDRQHPTYTQQELRELGVIFPGDELWPAEQGPWMDGEHFSASVPVYYGMLTAFGLPEELETRENDHWLKPFWEGLDRGDYVCSPWQAGYATSMFLNAWDTQGQRHSSTLEFSVDDSADGWRSPLTQPLRG